MSFGGKDFPTAFEVFLEIVDDAPCWDEDDKRCVVALGASDNQAVSYMAHPSEGPPHLLARWGFPV